MIPLTRPYFNQEEIREVKKVLDSGWVSQGPKTKEFEKKFAKYLGVKYAIAVSNGTAALHLSLLALNIKRGDEVLVADYTFPATGHSVLYCGAKPVFIDIDPKTYNINADLIEKKITKKTKVIIPVHTFGQPADMSPIMRIVKKYHIRVVEDAACAAGAKYKGQMAGTIGDIGCFSFHARKGITTGEGGMVVTNNKKLADEIRTLAVFGTISPKPRKQSFGIIIPKFIKLGYNYKMSDITAAVGIAQLRRIDKIIKRKRDLSRYWDKKLEEIDFIKPPFVDKNVFHIYQSYVALVDKKINRNKLIKYLKDHNIQTQIGTYASHIQPVYHSKQKCPNSLDVFKRALALPLYYTLKKRDIDKIIYFLKKFIKKYEYKKNQK